MPLEVNLLSQLRAMAAKYDAQGSPPASPDKLAVATRLVHPKSKVGWGRALQRGLGWWGKG